MNLQILIVLFCISTARGLNHRWYTGSHSRGWDYYFRTPRRTAYKVRVPTTKIASIATTPIRREDPTEAEWRTREPSSEDQDNHSHSHQASKKTIFNSIALSSNDTSTYYGDISAPGLPRKTSKESSCCSGSFQKLWDISKLFKKAIDKLTPTEMPQEPPSMSPSFPIVTSNSEMFQKCSNIKHKLLAELCRRVAKNPILQAMERNGRGVRGRIGLEELVRGSIRSNKVYCSSPKVCPSYHTEDDEILNKMQSLSPWMICSEYDSNR